MERNVLVEKRVLVFVCIALFVWAALASGISGAYYIQFNVYQKEYQSLLSTVNSITAIIEHLTNISDSLGNSTEQVNEMLESMSLKVDILMKTNETSLKWHNSTYLPLGSTAFTGLMAIANITYESYGEMGLLVTSVDGLGNTDTAGWFLWRYNFTSSEWTFPLYSADKEILHRGDVLAWAYQDYATWPPPPPS
jgi:hypothetical protein